MDHDGRGDNDTNDFGIFGGRREPGRERLMSSPAITWTDADRGERRYSTAWFAGYDLQRLRRVPSERGFADALGAAVLLLACANGFTAAVAVGYVLHASPSHLWWLGIAWTIVVACGIERLVLQVSPGKRRLLLLVVLPRLCVSLLLAVQFGEPLVLRFNQGEVNNYLSAQRVSEEQASSNQLASHYGPLIAKDRSEVAHIQSGLTSLAHQAEQERFLSRCEAITASCSQTHRLGCGAYCEHFARVSAEDAAELARREPEAHARVEALKTVIAKLEGEQKQQHRGRLKGVEQNEGLAAHEEALSGVEHAHPSIRDEVWFLRLLFFFLDVLPLSTKLVRTYAFDSPYDEISAAEREHDALDAFAKKEAVSVERDRIGEEARAQTEVNRERIWAEAETRMAGATGGQAPTGGHGESTFRSRRPEAVQALSLSEYSSRTSEHEQQPVPVPHELRRGGLVGLVLLAGTAVGSVAMLVVHAATLGLWLSLLAFAPAALLAAHTRGFRTATAWSLNAIFVVLIAGLLMPLLIVAVNL
jgi:hypothetical protein